MVYQTNNKMTLRKIKDLRRIGRGIGRTGHTMSDKNKEEHRNNFIKNNPMHNQEIAKRNAHIRKGKPQLNNPTRFKEGNNFGCLTKGIKKTERQKALIGLKNIGKINSNLQKEIAKENFIKNNPMKKSNVIQKIKDSWKRKKEIKKEKLNERRRLMSLENPKVKSHWFKRKVTPEMEIKIIEYYKDNMPCGDIGIIFGLSPNGIRRILERNKIPIRNHSQAAKVNNIIKNLKGKKEVENEKDITNNINPLS